MTLATDGPPTCPKCEAVTSPTWNFCAACGTDLEDPDFDGQLDHTDPDDLQRAYESADSITEAAEWFGVSYPTVRNAMIDHGIHEPESYG